MTDILYMHSIDDCYLKDFQAKVVEADTLNCSIELDRTAFYPEGGGQPSDMGTISFEGGRSKVVKVRKTDRVLHFLDGPVPQGGSTVDCRIDWERRFSHMRMHTSQHLISAVVWGRFGARTVGNQIHADRSHIDLRPASFSDQDLEMIKEDVNKLIEGDHPVTLTELERSRVESAIGTERVDLSRLPPNIRRLRTVLIGKDGSVDLCPCAGTHVRSLKELKGIGPLTRRSKGADTVRLEYSLL